VELITALRDAIPENTPRPEAALALIMAGIFPPMFRLAYFLTSTNRLSH
jgi:hypothetical protein